MKAIRSPAMKQAVTTLSSSRMQPAICALSAVQCRVCSSRLPTANGSIIRSMISVDNLPRRQFSIAASAADIPGAAEGAPTDAEVVAPPLPISQLDIRIGRILEIEKHPDADSLYVEKVDVGEEEPRTIISGLVEYVPLDEMQNRSVVVLANLKPRNMRGIKSHGMLMCASNADHTQVEPLRPPEGAQPGERVWFGETDASQPDAESPNKVQKKKIWEELQPKLKTDEGKTANWDGHVMMTTAGPITADTLPGANIS